MSRKLVFAMLLLAVGCGRRLRNDEALAAPPSSASPATSSPSTRPAGSRWVDPPPPVAAPAAPELIVHEAQVQEVVTRTPPPPRDLNAEFASALGDVSSCASSLPSGTRSSASIVAYLTQNGRVSRAEVSGVADFDTQRCVRSRAEGVSLAGPIEGAPRSVSASVSLASSAPAAPSSAPSVRPPGSVAPDAVLPATVDSVPAGRSVPPGAREPGIVLPARVEGRPPGFVPPSSTLPARVD